MWLLTVLAVCLLTGCGAAAGAEQVSSSDEAPETVSSDVQAPEPVSVPVSLSDLALEMGKGMTCQLTASGGECIQWHSSDPAVASVDDEGSVRAFSRGECVISAENEFGSRAGCAVKVKKTCYLTIDDGPGPYTQQILRVLRAHNVKVTFFVVNNSYIGNVKDIHEEGHAIGLHAGRHTFNYCYRSDNAYFCDLAELNERVLEETGEKSNLIRFPGGTNNSSCELLRMRRLANGAHDLGYRVFDWTSSSEDARPKPKPGTEEAARWQAEEEANASISKSDRAVINALEYCVTDEEIMLLHDLWFTPETLEKLIPILRRRGYVFETLDHYPERSFMLPCKYTYYYADVPAKELSFPEASLTLPVGGERQMKAIMTPANATDYIRWQSSDEKVFTVDPSGLVKARTEGKAWLFAFTSSNEWASCPVTVTSAEAS